MPQKLYSSDLEIFEVPFPKFFKKILHFFEDPLKEPITQESLRIARDLEKQINKGLIKFLIHGFSPKLARVVDINLKNFNLRIYTPISNEPLPVIIYYHGGGYVMGSIENSDVLCRKFAKDLNAVIVSVAYRLSPEFPFPIALEDSYSAAIWVNKHISELSENSKKIYVMGDSAGGGLATLVALKNKCQKDFEISGQILIYPWVSGEFNYPSSDLFKEGYVLSKKMLKVFRKCYITNPKDSQNPDFSPIYNSDLSKLPKTILFTASHDPLRDQGNAYAKKLLKAGNQVIYKNYLQTVHGFLTIYGFIPRGKKIYRDFIQTLRKMLYD
nr:alpha/beta hydrolase [Candidatus Prometheoarchaeum syntrophicum]QEE17702.1 acetyl esterase [Candidatus Prometheoarchaeum syntrophicum]